MAKCEYVLIYLPRFKENMQYLHIVIQSDPKCAILSLSRPFPPDGKSYLRPLAVDAHSFLR